MSVDHYECQKCHENGHSDYFRICVKNHLTCDWCRRGMELERGDPLITDDGELPKSHCPLCRDGGTKLEKAERRAARYDAALKIIDDRLCPLALVFPWIQPVLDEARKALEET